jgi:hypothetical protein
MASRLKKYIAAFASAKEYVAQWSADHVYADEALIVPFPTLAIFNPERNVWSIHIKAWLYLPLEGKKIKSYLTSLPSVFTRKTAEKINEDEELTDDNDNDDDVSEDALDEFS